MTRSGGPIRIDASPLQYQPALDGIRALAVLSVIAFHIGPRYLPGGVIGVDWFFVLSGFLITNLLLDERNREGSVSLRGFYHRRILRLFPAMYAFLAFMLLASPLLHNEIPDIWNEIAAASLYSYHLLIGFFGFVGPGDSPRALLQVWSLSVEEWFYFLWPILLIWSLARARSQRVLIIGCGLFIAFWMGLRLWAGAAGYDFAAEDALDGTPYGLAVLLRFSAMRFDALVIGCMLAVLRRRTFPMSERTARVLSLAGAVGLAVSTVALLGGRLAPFAPFTSVAYNASLFGVAACVLWLHAHPTSKAARFMASPILVYVGTRSYALYLWHEVPNALVPEPSASPVSFVLRAVAVLAVSFVLAELSWRLVESPFLLRKQRRYNRPTDRVRGRTVDLSDGRAQPDSLATGAEND